MAASSETVIDLRRDEAQAPMLKDAKAIAVAGLCLYHLASIQARELHGVARGVSNFSRAGTPTHIYCQRDALHVVIEEASGSAVFTRRLAANPLKQQSVLDQVRNEHALTSVKRVRKALCWGS